MSAPSFSIRTLIAGEGLAGIPQSLEERQQQAASLRESVFDVRRIAAVIHSHKKPILFHIAQASDERATANRVQVAMNFHSSPGARCEISND